MSTVVSGTKCSKCRKGETRMSTALGENGAFYAHNSGYVVDLFESAHPRNVLVMQTLRCTPDNNAAIRPDVLTGKLVCGQQRAGYHAVEKQRLLGNMRNSQAIAASGRLWRAALAIACNIP
jgi:hypothetical protein